MEGWVKIHRSITKWEWYDDSKTVHLFFHLLLSANHKNGNWRGQEIKRGQVITGRKKLSSVTGISERSIRTCLERLESTNEVTIKTTSKNSVITIVKYDFYQGCEVIDQPNDQQTTKYRPSTDQQTTTNKNDNNVKNEENEKETKLPKLKTKTVFSNEVNNLYDVVYPLFPAQSTKRTTEQITKQSNDWKDEIRKLIEIDGIDSATIEHVVRVARLDSFWSSNFQTIKKLRTKNKEGVKYIDFFISKFKNDNNGESSSNNRIKFAIEASKRGF